MQRVKLIFAALQKSTDEGEKFKMRVSIKNDWIYDINQAPEYTIGYTLRKFKIATSSDQEKELSKKYRAYRVREDQKTKYRYVTEILNVDEAK